MKVDGRQGTMHGIIERRTVTRRHLAIIIVLLSLVFVVVLQGWQAAKTIDWSSKRVEPHNDEKHRDQLPNDAMSTDYTLGDNPKKSLTGFISNLFDSFHASSTLWTLSNQSVLALNATCPVSHSGNVSFLFPYNTTQPVEHIWIPAQRSNERLAICAFQRDWPYAGRLPHTMQQLYKCFSYWQGNPKKKPVLLNGVPVHSKFISGFLSALEKVFGVQYIQEKHTSSERMQQYNELAVQPAKFPDYAMLSSEDARVLSHNIIQHYHIAKKPASFPPNGPRIGILNRVQSRALLNVAVIQDALQTRYETPVPIAYFEESDFLDQVEFYASYDIIVSPHGAQLAGLAFMPPCSGLLEIFPARYFLPHYFQALAQSSGVYHATLYLSNHSDPVLESAEARQQKQVSIARNVQMCPPLDKILEGVHQLVQMHLKCSAMVAH